MFIGRESEMEQLNRLYGEKGFQMPVVYGRRRVGKTRLISEFCRNKKTVFFTAIEQNDTEALRMFSEAVLQGLPGMQSSFITSFDSWDSAFRYAAEFAKDERIILVIDEFPYLASGNPSLPVHPSEGHRPLLHRNQPFSHPLRVVHELYGKPGPGLQEPPVRKTDCPVQDPAPGLL
ncbi:AAA family ATPase [Aminivibrio sp.]|uniref:AAA family ATPase n=1 Tax=Aminivibrio sp. TaxID=1872489 RepID=UPI003D959F4C